MEISEMGARCQWHAKWHRAGHRAGAVPPICRSGSWHASYHVTHYTYFELV
jgi:hypothetical protein